MFTSGTYCSPTPPADMVSDGNTLHISFSSNDKVVDTGFIATWRAVDPTEGKKREKEKRKIFLDKTMRKYHQVKTIKCVISVSFLILSSPLLTVLVALQLHVEGVSAVIRVKLLLLTGLMTTRPRLCVHGASTFLHQKVFM